MGTLHMHARHFTGFVFTGYMRIHHDREQKIHEQKIHVLDSEALLYTTSLCLTDKVLVVVK